MEWASGNYLGNQCEFLWPIRGLQTAQEFRESSVKVCVLFFVQNVFKKSLEFKAAMEQETFHCISLHDSLQGQQWG